MWLQKKHQFLKLNAIQLLVTSITFLMCSRTIIYELMALEQPYKSFPLETQIWRVGMGKVQELILLPRSQLRSLIARCWKEPPSHRPSFKEILNMLEQDVSVQASMAFCISLCSSRL